MKTTLKKLGRLAFCTSIMAVFCGGWTVEIAEEVAPSVISATLAPLQQCVPLADGGFPTPAFCTMYNNNNNAIRAATNTVSAAQAPELCPKTGCIYTGHIRQDNAGVIIGTNTAGITGAANSVIYQTADAGLVQAQINGNDYRVKTNLGGAQYMRIQNSAGTLDAVHSMNQIVQGAVVAENPSSGYYYQNIASGQDAAYGDASTFRAESPHAYFTPYEFYLVPNGSFTGTEVVTLRFTFYDDADAGISTTATFDAGTAASTITAPILWYLFAATRTTQSNSFQHLQFDRLVLDAMSDAGTTNVNIDVTLVATQN
jgi:hypothetical protein